MYKLELSVLAVTSALPKLPWLITVKQDSALVHEGFKLDLSNWPIRFTNASAKTVIEIEMECDGWVGGLTLTVGELEGTDCLSHMWLGFELISKETDRQIEAEMLIAYLKATRSSEDRELVDAKVASLEVQLATANALLIEYAANQNKAVENPARNHTHRGLHRDDKLLRKLCEVAKDNDNLRRSLSSAWKENSKKDSEIKKLKEELGTFSIEGTLNLSVIDIERNTYSKDSLMETAELSSIEVLLQKFLQEFPSKLNISKVAEGLYNVAGQQVTLKSQGGQLWAQVCGGALSFADFLKVQSKMQSRRVRQLSEEPFKERTANTTVPKLQNIPLARDKQRTPSSYKSPRLCTKSIEPVLLSTRSRPREKRLC